MKKIVKNKSITMALILVLCAVDHVTLMTRNAVEKQDG